MVDVCLAWNGSEKNQPLWTDVASLILEHFGLPGYRYTTCIAEEYLIFSFNDDRDGILCKILISEHL